MATKIMYQYCALIEQEFPRGAKGVNLLPGDGCNYSHWSSMKYYVGKWERKRDKEKERQRETKQRDMRLRKRHEAERDRQREMREREKADKE